MSYIEVDGYLGTDPEMTYTASGEPITRFRICSNEFRGAPDAQGQRARVENWFSVACYGRLAENAPSNIAKGDRAVVQGFYQFFNTQDRNGNPVTYHDVNARRIIWGFQRRDPDAAYSNESYHDSGQGQRYNEGQQPGNYPDQNEYADRAHYQEPPNGAQNQQHAEHNDQQSDPRRSAPQRTNQNTGQAAPGRPAPNQGNQAPDRSRQGQPAPAPSRRPADDRRTEDPPDIGAYNPDDEDLPF